MLSQELPTIWAAIASPTAETRRCTWNQRTVTMQSQFDDLPTDLKTAFLAVHSFQDCLWPPQRFVDEADAEFARRLTAWLHRVHQRLKLAVVAVSPVSVELASINPTGTSVVGRMLDVGQTIVCCGLQELVELPEHVLRNLPAPLPLDGLANALLSCKRRSNSAALGGTPTVGRKV